MARIPIEMTIVRLGAIIIVLNAFRNLSYHTINFYNPEAPQGPFFISVGLTFLMPCAIAMFLWIFPTKFLFDGSGEQSTMQIGSLTGHELLTVGILLLGLYATVFGVIDLLYVEAQRLIQYLYAKAYSIDRNDPSPITTAGRVASLAQITFGLILVLGRRAISRLLYKIRYGGVDAS